MVFVLLRHMIGVFGPSLSRIILAIVVIQLGVYPPIPLTQAFADPQETEQAPGAGGTAEDSKIQVTLASDAKSPSPRELLEMLRKRTTLTAEQKERFKLSHTVVNFPAEALTFYGAIFMTSVMDHYGARLANSGDIDPMPVQTMVNLLTDPIGYTGFLAFVLAANKTGHLATQWNLLIHRAEGFIKLQEQYPNFDFKNYASRSELIGKTIMKTPVLRQMAKSLQFMGGQSGFAMGMIASHLVEDYLRGFRADPDVKSCTQGILQEVEKSKHQAYQDACERAFDSWVRIDKKILEMAPSLAAGFLTIAIKSTMQAVAQGLISKAAGKAAEKGVTKVVFQGLNMAFNLMPVPYFKGAQVVVKLVDLTTFLTIQAKLSDVVIKKVWTLPEKGHALEKSRKGLYDQVAFLGDQNQWKDPEGWQGGDAGNKLDLMEKLVLIGNGDELQNGKLSLKRTAKQIVKDQLGFKKNAGAEFLEKLMDHQRQWQDWRYIILDKLMMAYSNWESYTANFLNATQMTNIYYNALAMSQGPENNKSLLEVDYFKGVQPDKDSAETLPLKERQKATLHKASLRIQESLKDGTLWSGQVRESLLKIVEYFRAADLGQPADKVLLKQQLAELQTDSMSPDELKKLEESFRDQTVGYGLRIAEDLLFNYDPKKSPGGVPKYIASKLPAKRFLGELREILGHPQPRFYKGQAYLQEIENIIFSNGGEGVQDVDIRHPKKIGRVATRRFADYLLASALCGPDLSQPNAQLVVNGDAEPNEASSDSVEDGASPTEEGGSAAQNQDIGAGPNPLIYRAKMGWGEYRFVPPRIVDNMGFNPCEDAPTTSKSTDLLGLGFKDPKARGINIHSGQWAFDGRAYDGFFDILMAHISPELVLAAKENEPSGFDRWWNQKVAPSIVAKTNDFRQEFQKILDRHYWPQTMNEKKSWIGHSPMGLMSAMGYEVSQYLWILQNIYRSVLLKEGSWNADTEKRYKEFTTLSEEIVKGVKDSLLPNAPAAVIKGLAGSLKSLEGLIQKEFKFSVSESSNQLPHDFRSQVVIALMQAISKQNEELNFYLMISRAYQEDQALQ